MSESYTFVEKPGASATSPVLFLFHGTGGDEQQFFALGPQLLSEARIVAVRGDVSEGGALRYFRRLAEGRYDMADLGRATTKLAAFIAAQRGAASAAYAFGYSNGANIIAATQVEAPALIERAVLLHPLIPFAPAAQPGLAGRRVLITAGRNDPICPAPATEALADWYRAQGAEVSQLWHAGGHELRQEELLAARDFLGAP
jgi:phospholipase/carboxylesterase